MTQRTDEGSELAEVALSVSEADVFRVVNQHRPDVTVSAEGAQAITQLANNLSDFVTRLAWSFAAADHREVLDQQDIISALRSIAQTSDNPKLVQFLHQALALRGEESPE